MNRGSPETGSQRSRRGERKGDGAKREGSLGGRGSGSQGEKKRSLLKKEGI